MSTPPPDLATLCLELLRQRADGATLCPSEVARAAAAASGSEDWRAEMDAVHAAVDGLVAAGVVGLSWKGAPLSRRAGPYRIRRIVNSGKWVTAPDFLRYF